MAVVEFYIQNYSWNGSVVTTETKFHEVPFSGEPPITNPKVKNEIGKAGSFEFGLELNSPYYNAMLQMKTILRVTYFGNTIFRGRVLTIDKTLSRTRTVHCEGDFAFLLDSHQIATKEETRPKIGVYAYLQQIINQHNSDMGDEAIKKFTLGEVPGHYSNATPTAQRVNIPDEKATQQFGDTSWNTSMDRLESLLSDFGGYFRTRYAVVNGTPTTYLDWYDKYYNTNTQTIEVAKNLIDLSGSTEVENLFTIVIPVGKNNSDNVFISDYWPIVSSSHAKVNYITVPELRSIPLYSDSDLDSDYHHKEDYSNAITRFGRIWKTVNFDNADTPEKLFSYAKDWMKNNFMPEITQWDVNALDMKIVNSTNQVLLCGDRVTLTHPEVDSAYGGLTTISTDYDLYNPDKNKYVIGIPNQEINTSYGVKKKSKGGGGGGGGKGISDQPDNDPEEAEKDLVRLKQNLQNQYWLKSESKVDIALDDPYAYLSYNTDGTKKDMWHTAFAYVESKMALNDTFNNNYEEVERIARLRGVDVHDEQLLIDLTPSEKLKQDQFKADSKSYMMTELEMTAQEADVILNETAGQSWLASLVTDSGSWSQYAYYQGIQLRTNADEIKEMAINTRRILQGEGPISESVNIANSFNEWITGGNLNIDQYLSYFSESFQNIFNIGLNGEVASLGKETDSQTGFVTRAVDFFGGLFGNSSEEKAKTSGTGTWFETAFNWLGILTGNNTESNGKEGSMTTDTMEVSGSSTTGTAQFKSASASGKLDGWDVTINKPITYTVTESGETKTYTVPAKSLAADDVHFTAKYDSLRAKLLVVDTLLADYAQITSLQSLEAFITNLQSSTGNINYIYANNVSASVKVSGTKVEGADVIYGIGSTNSLGLCFNGCAITEANGTIKFTFSQANGDTVERTFDMADTTFYANAVSAAHNNGGKTAYFTVTNVGPLNPGGSTTINAYYRDDAGNLGTPTDSGVGGRYIRLTVEAATLNTITAYKSVSSGGTWYYTRTVGPKLSNYGTAQLGYQTSGGNFVPVGGSDRHWYYASSGGTQYYTTANGIQLKSADVYEKP